MGNALFVIWRESIEALLVVGILYTWLRRNDATGRGMRFLWGGVAAGIGLALLLAFSMLGLAEILSDEAFEYFQLAMLLVAAALIVQMVFWMRRHGRHLKRNLESDMARNIETANWWGLLLVVMIAIGRESAETVVFLYGLGIGQNGMKELAMIIPLGIVLAMASFWLLQQGQRVLSWKHFFMASEVVLLLLAASLLVNGVERLIGFGWLPTLLDPVWNTSSLLSDSSRTGNLIAAFTGYRSQPTLSMVLIYGLFWAGIWAAVRRTKQPPASKRTTNA